MASKAEILEAIQSGNGERFSELIVSAFDDLGPLVPAVDEILNGSAPGLATSLAEKPSGNFILPGASTGE